MMELDLERMRNMDVREVDRPRCPPQTILEDCLRKL